jgi:hypothetical protein
MGHEIIPSAIGSKVLFLVKGKDYEHLHPKTVNNSFMLK